MRLKTESLDAHLKRGVLAPAYCLAGDEPLQQIECADAIRSAARAQGYDERTLFQAGKNFDWSLLLQQTANLSLFASRRIIDLRLTGTGPGREGSDALAAYCQKPPPDTLLLLCCGKLDRKSQQSRWFKALDGAGVTILIYPVDPAQLPAWIAERFARHGRRLEPGVAELIAQRVEGNLLAARQDVEKLLLLTDRVSLTVEDALQAVGDSARFEVFGMVEAALRGDAVRTLRMLRGLRAEGAAVPELLGALLWELRQVCGIACDIASGMPREQGFAARQVWPQRRAPIEAALKRLAAPALTALLGDAGEVDRAGKGALREVDPWQLLERLVLGLAGLDLAWAR
jgi:DNA polymerase-3 subunit delta